jgi:hypothetical protein
MWWQDSMIHSFNVSQVHLFITPSVNDDSSSGTWFSAMRIGLQIPNIDSKYQLFAVKAPVDKDAGVGDDGLLLPINIGIDHILPT